MTPIPEGQPPAEDGEEVVVTPDDVETIDAGEVLGEEQPEAPEPQPPTRAEGLAEENEPISAAGVDFKRLTDGHVTVTQVVGGVSHVVAKLKPAEWMRVVEHLGL